MEGSGPRAKGTSRPARAVSRSRQDASGHGAHAYDVPAPLPRRAGALSRKNEKL
jgi:hypothetical protein